MFDDLREAIAARRTRAGVIGLGYVGLPLLAELASSALAPDLSGWTCNAV